jgi:acetyl-CoA carboxylase biotin carboxyl carrier protein
MEWSEQQILETLRFIEASDFDEVKLQTDGFTLHVRKSGAPATLDTSAAASESRVPSSAPTTVSTAEARPQAAAAGATAGARTEPDVPAGTTAIRAPMIGTFYRAPAPHLPPFVEVGTEVKPDDTVCLLEVMKLFNTIKAGVSGKIVQIVAQNAATVGKDELLMIIEPLA